MSTEFTPAPSRLDTITERIDRRLGPAGTRLAWLGEHVLLCAGPVRAVLDSLLVNGIVLALVWFLDPAPAGRLGVWLAYPFVLNTIFVCVLRLRVSPGWLAGRNLRDSLVCLAVLLPLAVAWVFMILAQGQGHLSMFGALTPDSPPLQTFLVVAAEYCLIFLGLRGAVRLWIILERLQRRHLRWRLTYALLVIVVVLTLVGLMGIGFYVWSGLPVTAGLPLPALLLWAVLYVPFYFMPLFIYTAIPVLIVGTVGLLVFSYGVTRSLTRGLELLVREADALRSGNYEARVTARGEDEVAQLQHHFNRMAATLEQTLVELRDERDALKAEKELTQHLTTQIAELRIEIDQQRRARDVAEITGTDYFHDLQKKAAELRARRERPVTKQ